MTFNALEIGTTASRLAYLSRQFEENALDLTRTLDAHDAIATPQQAAWMQFLLEYSKTLKFYAAEARRISEMN